MFYKYAGSQKKCLNNDHVGVVVVVVVVEGGGGKLSHPLIYHAIK